MATLAVASSPARGATLSEEWIRRWRADLAFAADSLPRAHPNFFHSVSPEVYRAALDSLSARVPTLEHHEIAVELGLIVAMVHDGHTRLTFPFDSAAGFFTGHTRTAPTHIPGLVFRHYPIRLGLFADTLFVIRADAPHRELLGGRVVTLGRMSASEAMAAVEPVVQRDNDAQVRDLLPTWLVCPEILHARGVVAERESAPIVVEKADGSRVNPTLAPVTPGASVQWNDARGPGSPPLRDRFPERSHWFTWIPGRKSIYARYREVRDDPTESVAQFAESLFAAVESGGADRLVLDLRGNVGGDGGLNRSIVQRLIRTPRLWHAGGLWALTDRGTFSAAVMLASDLEMRTPSVLVGEKTGGHPNSYGDSRRVVLPNTGLTVRVSSLFWQLTSPQDPRDGISPHVEVEPRFADWLARRDPPLEAALARGGPASGWTGEWRGAVGWQFRRFPFVLTLARRGAEPDARAGAGRVTTWTARLTLPAAGLEDSPATEVRATADGVTVRWEADGEWMLELRPAGDRLAGVVHYGGLDYAVVLERPAGK